MNKKNKLLFSIIIIILLFSITFNIVNYLNYKYHLEVHKRYDARYHSYLRIIRGHLDGIEDTLIDVIDKKYLTYKDCIFLNNVSQYLYEDFNSLKELFKHVYFQDFKFYDPYKTSVFKAEWVEPRHDLLIPINQLFSSTLSEYSEKNEQIDLSALKLITSKKLENIKDIISSIKLIILNKQDKLGTITNLKVRIRIRFEEINEINILLKSKENYINSILKEF